MNPKNFNIGDKIKNINTGDILKNILIDGEQVWEEAEYGDIFNWVDEDLYEIFIKKERFNEE